MAAPSPCGIVAHTTQHSKCPFSTSSKAVIPKSQLLYIAVGRPSTSQRRTMPLITQTVKRGFRNISSGLVINCKDSNSCSSSLYSILGVKPNVALPELKRAYRNLALRFHPDVCSTADVAEGTLKFLELQNAYRVLSDPEQIADYDYHFRNSNAAHDIMLRFPSKTSGLRSKDYLERASWKSQWENQIRNLRCGCKSGEQERYHRTWGSRMREQNTQNPTTS